MTKFNADRLDFFIEILRQKFPNFKYINGMKEDCRENHLMDLKCPIFVKNISDDKREEFTSFVFDNIYMKFADTDEELPEIVPLSSEAQEQDSLEIAVSWNEPENVFFGSIPFVASIAFDDTNIVNNYFADALRKNATIFRKFEIEGNVIGIMDNECADSESQEDGCFLRAA